jgi:hypothetical protein
MSLFCSGIESRVLHCIKLSHLLRLLQAVMVPSHSLLFMTLALLSHTGQLFCTSSVRVYLMFSHDVIVVVDFGRSLTEVTFCVYECA